MSARSTRVEPDASSPRAIARLVMLYVFTSLASTTPALAQSGSEAPAAPSFPFEQFMPNPFGESTPEEEAELAKVPISVADEKRQGDADAASYLAGLRRQKLKVVSRGRDVAYLRELVDALRPYMTNKERYPKIVIYLVESPGADARSFPGGTLVVFRGLLDFVDSEAALVGVLGHELSHLDRGHQMIAARRMKRFEQSMSGGAASPQQAMSSLRAMVGGFARPFRPEDETQADRDGAEWAFRAGYDPDEFAAVLLKLHHRDGKGAVPISFLRTHPFHIDRCRAIEVQARALRAQHQGGKLYVGKENLEQRTSRARREFPE